MKACIIHLCVVYCWYTYRPSDSSHPQPYGAPLLHFFFFFYPLPPFLFFCHAPEKKKLAALLCWGDFQWRRPSPTAFLFIFTFFNLGSSIVLFNMSKGCDDWEHSSILIRTKASCLVCDDNVCACLSL